MLERIGFMRFRSPEDVAEFAKQIDATTEVIRERMAQEESTNVSRQILCSAQELERSLRALAIKPGENT